MSDKCQRCGIDGPDMRTLWMACWYDMAELSVPFELRAIRGKTLRLTGSRKLPEFNLTVPVFEADPKAVDRDESFYTLTVCKSCRADWMQAIESWFRNIYLTGEDGVQGAYIRDKGTNRLMTQAEIDEKTRDKQEDENDTSR